MVEVIRLITFKFNAFGLILRLLHKQLGFFLVCARMLIFG